VRPGGSRRGAGPVTRLTPACGAGVAPALSPRQLESRVEARLAASEVRLIRWMFLFWVGTLGTVIALLKL